MRTGSRAGAAEETQRGGRLEDRQSFSGRPVLPGRQVEQAGLGPLLKNVFIARPLGRAQPAMSNGPISTSWVMGWQPKAQAGG